MSASSNQPVPEPDDDNRTEADEVAAGDEDREQSPLRIEEQGLDPD
jgi:hypothetical protein